MKRFLPALILCGFSFISRADEGMWPFNDVPRDELRQRYQFDASDAWLDHLQKSSIRFNSGGSGSFVSADGLLISNHHVGADALQKLSSKDKDYVHDGFYAKTSAEEIKCLDLELNVLDSIEDVTARVNTAVPDSLDAAAAFAARRKIIAEIEKESQDRTGLRSDVVTLWQGGAYHLYRYRRYTDVRLVFAPEEQTAFYGGDPDNFEFPRYDLDICLFRAYDNGKPLHLTNYLHFSATGPVDGDLVFVSGHPGRTGRLLTVAELTHLRDAAVPFILGSFKRVEVLLTNWSQRSEENARRAKRALFGIKNSRKGYDGRLAGLLDPELFSAKVKAEADFKAQLSNTNDKKAVAGPALDAYGKIAEATKVISGQAVRSSLIEDGLGFSCDSFRIARTLLRAGDERPKPNGDRLREYSDSGRVSLELGLFSEKPIYTDLEILTLSDSLTFLATQLGGDDVLVKKALAGKSPHERALELVNGTKVRGVALRKKLYADGAAAVTAANDPMIELARLIDADARALRKVNEDQDEIRHQAHAAISRARNALLGTAGYPDATFTLRLAYGTVKGYEEDGKAIAPFTTFGGLFQRDKEMKNETPYNLMPLWQKRQSRLNPKTPFNFVSTGDIIGGNSGSPVVNRAGEFIGIIFDGNIQSLPWDYAFTDKQGRATSVDSAAILEALGKVYGASELAQELARGDR